MSRITFPPRLQIADTLRVRACSLDPQLPALHQDLHVLPLPREHWR